MSKKRFTKTQVRNLMQAAADDVTFRTLDHLLQYPTPGNIKLAREIVRGAIQAETDYIASCGIQPRVDYPVETKEEN